MPLIATRPSIPGGRSVSVPPPNSVSTSPSPSAPSSPNSAPSVPMTRTPRSPPTPRSEMHAPIPRYAPPPPVVRPRTPRTPPPPPPAPPGCRGFVLAHDSPTATEEERAAKDAFALVPCPKGPTRPALLSSACADSEHQNDSSCARGIYCPTHWCGSCRRLARMAERAERERLEKEAADKEEGQQA